MAEPQNDFTPPRPPRFVLNSRSQSLSPWSSGLITTLRFNAATGPDDRDRVNADTFLFSPKGTIELACVNADYADRFVLGQVYSLALIPVSE